MATVLITYDLRLPVNRYEPLFKAIKAIGPWCHPFESVWIVKTDFPVVQIRDYLRTAMSGADSIFVTQLGADCTWTLASPEVSNWLQNNILQ